jgi:hypothetical protein
MKSCELCERDVERTSRHHLIPRALHSNKWFKKKYTKEHMSKTVDLCRNCHREIHKFATEKELGKYHYTLDKLMEHEKIRKFVEWLKR